MYRTVYSLALLLCISLVSFAQPQITLSKTIDGSDIELVYDMIADEQGNLIALCLIDSLNQQADCDYKGGSSDIVLIKMDASGNILWEKCFGGGDSDYPYQVIKTQDDGFLFVGTTFSNDGDVSFNHGGNDIWLVKTDSLGNLQWQNSIGSSSSESPYDLNQLSDGSYVLAAYSLGSNGDFPEHHGGLNHDAWLIFITSGGEVDTAVHYGGSDDDYIEEVIELANGDLMLFGATASVDFDLAGTMPAGSRDAWMMKTDSQGSIKWTKRWGGNFYDAITGAIELPDGGYLTAGFSDSNTGDFATNHGGGDVWVMRLDSWGNVLLSKLLGGSGNDVVDFRYRIHDAGNGLFTIGARTLSWDGDVGLNIGYNDFWFLTIDSNCHLISSKISGGSNEDFLQSNSMSGSMTAIQAGITFSNDHDIVDLQGEQDGWFIKIEGITLIGTIEPESRMITVYPNPLHESFNLTADDETILTNAHLEIYSASGMLLIRKKIRDNADAVSVRGLSPGIYPCIVRDKQNKQLATARLIVQ
jgi:hypothetical protein